MNLVSFDIFDTVLIRKCGKPENIFYLMAEQLYPNDEAKRDDFVLRRKQAEGQAKKHIKEELTIKDIYSQIICSDYSSVELINIEKGIEKENLIVNPEILQKIEDHRSQGWNVAFISDMYLDSAFLKGILEDQGCFKEGDRIYISCDYNARKSTGALYDIVRRDLSLWEWKHYGDNQHSDVKMARHKGIKAIHVDTAFREIEKSICSTGRFFRDSWKMSLLAGYSRNVRLQHKDDPYVRIAADYVAPAYIPYVLWVLEEARKEGIERLYFLSRDSYILMKIAEQLPHDGIELRYLFLSRKSLILPYLGAEGEEAYLKIIDKHTLIRKRVKDLLGQLKIDIKDLAKYGIAFDYSQITNNQQCENFINKIFHSEFTKELRNRIESETQLLLRYFQQEGLFEQKRSAMVDVGWLGTTRLMVNQILRKSGVPDVDFFYYGVRGDVYPLTDGNYHSFFKESSLSSVATGLIENYMSASPYPSTIGYEESEDGRIVARFLHDATYRDIAITIANVAACEAISNQIAIAGLWGEDQLFTWSKESVNSLSTLRFKEELTPLLACEDMDGTHFVKRFSVKEFLRFILGYNISVFDLGSIEATLGKLGRRAFWPLHSVMGQVQHIVLTKIMMKS